MGSDQRERGLVILSHLGTVLWFILHDNRIRLEMLRHGLKWQRTWVRMCCSDTRESPACRKAIREAQDATGNPHPAKRLPDPAAASSSFDTDSPCHARQPNA